MRTTVNNIKKLPRNQSEKLERSFMAMGKKYVILDAEKDGITIERWTAFQKMSLVVGYAATFGDFTRNLDKAIQLCNGVVTKTHNFTDLALHLSAMKKGIVDAEKKSYDFSLYFCTLFIVEETEDLTKFDESFAAEKIKNWNDEGYDMKDFFLLARHGIPEYWEYYKKTLQEIQALPQNLFSDNIGAKGAK